MSVWSRLIARPGEPDPVVAVRALQLLHAAFWGYALAFMVTVAALVLMLSEPWSEAAAPARADGLRNILPAVGVPALLASLSLAMCHQLRSGRHWAWLGSLALHLALMALYGWLASNGLTGQPPGWVTLVVLALLTPMILAAGFGTELLVSPPLRRVLLDRRQDR